MTYLVYQPCGHTFAEDGQSLPAACPYCNKANATRKHKFNAKPVQTEHGYFHSTGEWKRYNELLILQKAGSIWGLERQKAYQLDTIRQKVVWDFYYMEVINGAEREVAEDFKGAITAEYRRKKRAFQEEYPDIIFRETKRNQAKAARRSYYKAAKRRAQAIDSRGSSPKS